MSSDNIIYGASELKKMWDTYDAAPKNRYGVMQVNYLTCDKSTIELLDYLNYTGVKLLAIRKNGYLMNPGCEGLIIRKPLDFSPLGFKAPNYNFELCCVDINVDDEDFDNLGPYIKVDAFDECEILCTFDFFDILRAAFGPKDLKDRTEQAIAKLEDGIDIDGWAGYEEPADPALKKVIDSSLMNLFTDSRLKPLYTYQNKDLYYLIILNLDSDNKVHWNILRYDDGAERKRYEWASKLDVTDPRFFHNVDVLLDYVIKERKFTGLGYNISMTDKEFKDLLPYWLYKYKSHSHYCLNTGMSPFNN